MCLMIDTCLLVYLLLLLLLLLSYTIRARTDNARSTCVHEGRRTDEAQEQSSRVSRPICHIRPIRPSSAPMHGEQPRRRLAIVVDEKGFFCAAPGDGIYTGCPSNLSLATTSFCPDDVPPFELIVGSDKPTPMCVIRWSDDIPTSCNHYAAAVLNL